jgi:hypothetical protein
MRSPGLISRPTALLVADLPAHDVSRGAKSTFSVAAGPQGEIVLSGTATPNPGVPSDLPRVLPEAWLMKLDSFGTQLWVTPMDVGKLALDGTGNAYNATNTSVTKLAPNGSAVWRWSTQTTGVVSVGAVAVGPDGHLVVAGTFSGTYDFGNGPVDSGAGTALFVMVFAE